MPDLLFQIIHPRPVVSDQSYQTCCFRSFIPDLLFQIIHARPVVSDHSSQTCCFRSFIPDLLFQIIHARPVVSDHSCQTCCFRSFMPDLLFQINHTRPVVSDHSSQTCCFRSVIPDLVFQIIHPSGAKLLKSKLPNCCDVTILKNCGHSVDLDRPMATCNAIVRFRGDAPPSRKWLAWHSWWIKMLWFYHFAFSVKQVPDFVAFIKCLQEQVWCDFIMCLKNSS